jgi:hypothetical protein
MKRPINAIAFLLGAMLWLPPAWGEPAPKLQHEVDSLLGSIARSGCEFYRNGTWYNAQQAVSHLRDKYRYLTDNNMVTTTEQFIERGASESSFSGKPYRIRCNGGTPVNSEPWLRGKLAEL